jgi:hypothetical protein
VQRCLERILRSLGPAHLCFAFFSAFCIHNVTRSRASESFCGCATASACIILAWHLCFALMSRMK